MTRRTLYHRVVLLLAGAMGAAITAPAVAYLLGPFRRRLSNGWADAGSLAALPDGKPTEIVVQRQRHDAWKKSVDKMSVWALKRDDGQVVAYSPRCTHLGCGYRWISERDLFVCPCHDSTFSIDGEVLSGPAPRALDRFETRIEGDRLWLGDVQPSEEA